MPQCNVVSYAALAAGLGLFGYAGYLAYQIMNTDIFPGFEDSLKSKEVETWTNVLNTFGGVFYNPEDTSKTCDQVFDDLLITWDCAEPSNNDGTFTACLPAEEGNFSATVELEKDCVSEDIPEGDKVVRSAAKFQGYIATRVVDTGNGTVSTPAAPGKYTAKSSDVAIWAVWRNGEALKDLIGGAIQIFAVIFATCLPLCCGTIALCTSLFVFLSSSPPREQAATVTTVQMTYMDPAQQQQMQQGQPM